MSKHATPKQLDVLRLMRGHYMRHGITPTIQQLSEWTGTSKTTVYEHLQALASKSLLSHEPGKRPAYLLRDVGLGVAIEGVLSDHESGVDLKGSMDRLRAEWALMKRGGSHCGGVDHGLNSRSLTKEGAG